MTDLGLIQEVLDAGIRLPFDEAPHQFQIEDLNDKARARSQLFAWGIGLGKSMAGAITGGYKLLHGYSRVFVVAPASILQQWKEVLDKMGFDAVLYVGSPTARAKLHFDHDFIVVGFEIFQKDYDRIKNFPGFYVVDEAVILSNPNNIFYKMFNGGTIKKKIPVPGRMKPEIKVIQYEGVNHGACLLTATPSNNPGDLYGLIKTVAPEIYVNEFQFRRLHVSEENIFGAPSKFQNLDLLRDNLRSVASIREVTDHLDMPLKSYNIIEYDLDPDHFLLYKRLMEERLLVHEGKIVVDALSAGALYNFAQKIILSPDIGMYKKPPRGLELLDNIVRNNPQTLIVNHYNMTNEKLVKRFSDLGSGGCFGGISRAKQTEFVQAFKEGRLRVLLTHPRSGGTGLNLQVCPNVVFPELPITARDYRQCEGRVWRQGQKERVIVSILIARKTIQKTLLKRVLDRDDVNSEVLGTTKTLRQELFPNE